MAATAWGGGVSSCSWLAGCVSTDARPSCPRPFAAASCIQSALLVTGLAGEGNEWSPEVLELPTRLAPDSDRSPAPKPAATIQDVGHWRLDAEHAEGIGPTVPLDDSRTAWDEEPTPSFRADDVRLSELRLVPDHGPLRWVDRRLLELSERLEQRVYLDPELRRIGDFQGILYSEREEQQRQELASKVFDEIRSGFTWLAREQMKPLREDASETLLEEPLIRLFSLDSADRDRGEEADPVAADGEGSLTVVRSTRSRIPRLVQSLAEWSSRAVPGEIDFRASITSRRARVGASYRPWTDVDDPPLLQRISLRASRDYEAYWTHAEIVDRLECRMDLVVSTRTRARLALEREVGDRESQTRLGLSWVCRF